MEFYFIIIITIFSHVISADDKPLSHVVAENMPSMKGCWYSNVPRKAHPVQHCVNGTVKSGWLCYPPCVDGYYGVGPVCWKNGSAESYGRGVGKPFQCGDDQTPMNLLCYDECPHNLFISKDKTRCMEKCPILYPLKCEGLCVSDKRFCQSRMLRLFAKIFAPFRGFGKATGNLVDASGNPAQPPVRGERSLKMFAQLGKMMRDVSKMAREIIELPPCKIFALNQTHLNITISQYE